MMSITCYNEFITLKGKLIFKMQNNNLTSQAYRAIMKRIIDAEYNPGQKISEKKIENDIGIGRTPVREALLQLRQENLIKVVPQSGTYISKIDMKDVLDARFVRSSVEKQIMINAASIDLTKNEIIHFNQILTSQKQLITSKQFPQFLKSDDDFHQYFYIITGHAKIWKWLSKINIPFDRFRFLRLKVADLSNEDLVNQHIAIYKAVKFKDINEVERLTANHMHLMLTDEQSLIKAFPEFFDNYQE